MKKKHSSEVSHSVMSKCVKHETSLKEVAQPTDEMMSWYLFSMRRMDMSLSLSLISLYNKKKHRSMRFEKKNSISSKKSISTDQSLLMMMMTLREKFRHIPFGIFFNIFTIYFYLFSPNISQHSRRAHSSQQELEFIYLLLKLEKLNESHTLTNSLTLLKKIN
jgi:hypothetical protein